MDGAAELNRSQYLTAAIAQRNPSLPRVRAAHAGGEAWESKINPDSRITKMEGGRTHVAYIAKHVADAGSDLLLAAAVYQADHADTKTLLESLLF